MSDSKDSTAKNPPPANPALLVGISPDEEFRLELPKFEGPLDLLLHLCQKHEVDIVALPVAFITERYLAYLDLMRSLNLDIASEYLVMAATLVHIKSRLLLPPDPTQDDADELGRGPEEDPREALIRRLLEYQKYKAAGDVLASRSVVGRDVFVRGSPEDFSATSGALAEVSLFKLLDALEGVLVRAKMDLAREITTDRISINERMAQLTEILSVRETVRFDELFDGSHTIGDVVVTFLAILEMAKRKLVQLYQPGTFEAIFLKLAVTREPAADTERPHETP